MIKDRVKEGTTYVKYTPLDILVMIVIAACVVGTYIYENGVKAGLLACQNKGGKNGAP